MAKKNIENSLIKFLSQNIKKDNKTKEELIRKIEKSVEQFVKENKKDFEALDPVSYTHLTSPTYLIRKISEKKYAKKSLISSITNNLKRAPGNLGEEEKVFEMYNVLEGFDFQCPYSDTLLIGGEQTIHIDHIIPVSLGGPTDDWNCIPVCETCNLSKKDKHLLDWWEEKHTAQEEYKLVPIFEHMTSKLLEKKNIKYITTLTDEQIRQTQAEENEDFSNDEEISRLDVITFLFQMLKNFEANKQYLIEPSDLLTAEQTQKALEDKLIKLTKTFNLIYKQNQRTTNAKTDIELLNEQKQMVERLKQWGIISHYKIAYNHFDELQQMIDQNIPEEEIKQFCYDKDTAFNIDKFIEDLQTFLREHEGRYPNKYAEDPTEKKLGKQVNSIRQAKKGKGDYTFNDTMKDKLDAIGFVWEVDRSFDIDKFIENLQRFIQENDGKYPSAGAEDPTEKKLGKQVNSIRQAKKGKGGYVFNETMKDKLDAIGFVWIKKEALEIDKFIVDLQTFLRDNKGKYPSTEAKDPTEKKLGGQVQSIRQAKKEQGDDFDKTRENKLNAINFVWDAKKVFDIDKFIEELQAFLRENQGKYPSAEAKDPTEKKLGGQVHNLRQAKKEQGDDFDKTRENKLNAINFVWDAKSLNIDKFIEDLQTFIQKHGRYPSTEAKDPTEKKLGGQVSRIRLAKQGKGGYTFNDTMKDKLDAIGFVWEVDRSFDIDKFIKKLQIFIDKHGRYPYKDAEDPVEKKLGVQVQAIRQAKKGNGSLAFNGTMEKKLDAIGFLWEGQRGRRTKKEEKQMLRV